MVTLGALWLPILLSAVIVLIASAIAWTVAPHHKPDFRVIPDQDDFLENVGKRNLAPGQYWFPFSTDPADMKNPDMIAKQERGPVGLMTVWPAGTPKIGRPMALSFVHYLLVGVMLAYVSSRTLSADASYIAVFRISGTISVVAYVAGIFPDAIWFGTPWRRTWLSAFDGVVYGLLTAGVFGWLWPG